MPMFASRGAYVGKPLQIAILAQSNHARWSSLGSNVCDGETVDVHDFSPVPVLHPRSFAWRGTPTCHANARQRDRFAKENGVDRLCPSGITSHVFQR